MKPNKSQIADVPPAKQKRKARIQPHAILGVAVSCLAAGAFVAYAATGGHFSFPKSSIKAPVSMKSKSVSTPEGNDGAKAQLLGETKGAKKGGFLLTQAGGGSVVVSPRSIVGPGRSGNNLSEIDLTPNTQSDEREAAFSPNGQYIAFRSTGVDLNKDGKLDAKGLSAGSRYHLWVGKLSVTNGATSLSVYQVTGQSSLFLEGFDQFRPVWSTNSRELAFVSNSPINGGANSGQQIYRINLNLQNDGTPQPDQPYNLTNFAGEKKSPAWSLNGTELVFAAKSSILGGTGTSFDLFRISSGGQSTLFTRVTGGTAIDAAGAAADVDDINPAFSLTQQNVVYFSSNRTAGAGRRIFVVRTDGTGLQQVTNPLRRTAGAVTDNDEYPALSLDGGDGGINEVLAFQSNSLIDGSDKTRDRNIWAFTVNSRSIGEVPTNPSAKFYVSAFNGGQVKFYNAPIGNAEPTVFNVESGANNIPDPEGLVYFQDSVYVSSRTRNRVERLDSGSGAPKPGSGRTGSAFTPNDAVGVTTPTGRQVPSPSGLAIFGGYLYVASGKDTKTAVYRYSAYTGAPAGKFIPGTATVPGYTSGEFTFGEPTAKPLGTGNTISEGVAISRDGSRLYVSNYAQNRVNIYTLNRYIAPIGGKFNETGTTSRIFEAGEWLGEITAPQATSNVPDPDAAGTNVELRAPTGVTIGPDLNGDNIEDLYVASSIYNDVLGFALDQYGASQPLPDGKKFKLVISDDQFGSRSGLSAPEGVRFAAPVVTTTGTNPATTTTTNTLYVSTYGGGTVNRYKKVDTKVGTDPVTEGTWVNAPSDAAGGNSAAWITGISGPAYFDFNTLFSANFVDINGTTTGSNGVVSEGIASAYVITNILSSPNNFAASDLNRVTYDSTGKALTVNVTEDTSADIEANFGRDDADNPSLASRVRVIFSSNRKYAAIPASNGVGSAPSNPDGGPDATNGVENPQSPLKNFDLWITAAADLEAPVIEPEQNNYPMLSPTHVNSTIDPETGVVNPDIGPRTKRGGLTAGGIVKFALTVKEQESGLAQVSFGFTNPLDIRRFNEDGPGGRINDNKPGLVLREKSPSFWPRVTGFDFDDPGMSVNLVNPVTGATNAPVAGNYFSDQGPRGATPERQSNAVAGDGIYYIAKQIQTPNAASDYFVSVRLTDRNGNQSYYYFIWGFTTQDFAPSTSNDIFVSDNTAGQEVSIGNLGGSFRYRIRMPVESFYLDNWGGNTTTSWPYTAGSIGKLLTVPPFYEAEVESNYSVTLPSVDVWRILCRGPIDEDIVSTNYIPSTVTQINPDKLGKNSNGFTIKDKVFANVQRAILWASPYAGTAEVEFDVPGSIKEGATKQQLKRLLAGGGRLFLTGRNVLTALDEGGADNSFRTEELFANPNGKTSLNGGDKYQTATAIDPLSGNNAFPERRFPDRLKRAEWSDLQFGWTHNNPATQDDYRDSSYSHDIAEPVQADTYTAVTGANVTVYQAYTANGNPFGQRIIKKRSTGTDSGLESRVVFFPFNFDGVNRRYRANPLEAFDIRRDVADGIRTWFKTGTVNGSVVDNTGAKVANALVGVSSGADLYYARTDANGFYELKGLPAGRGYSVFFIFNDKTFDGNRPDGVDGDNDDRDDLPINDVNRNYFTGVGTGTGELPPGGTSNGNEIRVEKISPTSITGRVYTYAGSGATDNPLDRSLHTPIGGIQVLLTVVPTTPASTTPVYTRLTKTSATGEFTFADAPPGRNLLLILNPKPTDVPAGSDIVNPNDPANTSITYNKEYGRRVIPIAGDKRRTGAINGTQNDVFVVNDTYEFDASKTSLSEYGNPPVDTAADEKDDNQVSLPVVLTRGEPISGKFTLQAGVDAPRFGAGWKVKLISTDTPPRTTRQVETKADGSFTFDEVIFGKYELEGTVPADVVNGYDKLIVKRVGIDTDTLTDATRLTQDLTAKISHLQGYVKVNGGYVSGATVSLKNLDGTPVEFNKIKREGRTGSIVNNANYFIGFVPDGTYNLTATLADGKTVSPVRQVKFDSTVATANLLKIENFDFSISQLEVNVSTLYAGLSKNAITVKLFKTATPTVEYRSLDTDANGNVTFIGIEPGNYNITATKTLNGVTSTTSLNNKLVTGATTTASLVLKWDSIRGVVRLNNEVQEGARVQFFFGNIEQTALEVTTNSSGIFEAGKTESATLATPLKPGTYKVRASLVVGGLTLSQEKTITLSTEPLGQIISVGDFNFVPAYLTGKVLLNGVPASGFKVELYNSDNTLFKDDGNVGRSAVTDASGTYRMDYVPAGNNFIVKATRQFNSITAAGQVTVPTVLAAGKTEAGNINITIANTLRGQVTVNGVGAGGARIQVLLKNAPVGSAVVTDSSGNYFIAGLADGSYKLNADYSEGGFALKTLSKTFTVKKGIYKAAIINFAFKVTRLTGTVTVNGKGTAGVAVTLLDAKGKALKVPVSGTTDANGKYVLSGVKAATYQIKATFGTSTKTITQKVGNLATTVAPTIDLSRQELEATTVIKIGVNGSARVLPDATIEILGSTGNLIATATSDANGKAIFYGLANGSYKARVSAQGVTTTTTFTVTTGITTQTFPITLSQASGFLSLSESNNLRTTELGGIDILRASLLVKPTANVVVTFTANTPAEARLITGTTVGDTVNLTFTTTNWNVAQTVTFVGQQDNQADGDEPFTVSGKVASNDTLFAAIPVFTLSGTNFEAAAAPTAGPTFPANSKNLVSTPFTAIDGTLPVSTVFGTTGYTLYRFKAEGQKAQPITPGGAFPGSDWVVMSGSDKMQRGRGYLLVTGASAVTMQIPANPTVFSGDTFAVDVFRNKNYAADSNGANAINNGYDLVGFPFDPNTVTGFNIFESQVLAEGILYNSYAEAAGAGKVSNRIYTVDSLGRPKELTPADSTIRPYRGYFVKIFVDSAKIIMKASPSNGSGSASGSGSSVSGTSAKSF